MSEIKSVNQQREKTLLLGCLLSAWAPLTTAYAAYMGQSLILVGDFLRRSTELMGLVFAWYIARVINQGKITTPEAIDVAERRSGKLVAVAMILSGIFIGISTIYRFWQPTASDRIGLGIFVSAAGTLVNGAFYLRFTKILKTKFDNLVLAQKRLYRTKAITDILILTALLLSRILPLPFALYADPVGSSGITILLLVNGIKTLRSTIQATEA